MQTVSEVVGSVCMWLPQSCLTPCDPRNRSPPGPSVHGILQARILEWIAMPSSRGCSQPRDQIHVSCIGVDALPIEPLEYTFYSYLVDRKEYGVERL